LSVENLNCFFVVGAPRCGTTAIASYLKQHKLIGFSRPKETNFFVTAKDGTPPAVLKAQFLKTFFSHCDGQERLLGEGSVTTLYSPQALKRAQACFPDARFIVMLRNPLDQLRSYHGRLLYLRQETVRDFETAWNLQDDRAAGRNIPFGNFDARLLQYREVASFGRYTAQLFDVVGRERCLPVFFEDFTSDTVTTYRQVLAFLGLPDDGRTVFKQKNRQHGFRSAFWQDVYSGAMFGPLGRLLVAPPRQLARLARLAQPLRQRLKRRNTLDVTLPAFDPALADRLRAFFREDVEHLSRLLQRDLSHWLATPQPKVEAAARTRHGEPVSV
jgi:hypothetical protein